MPHRPVRTTAVPTRFRQGYSAPSTTPGRNGSAAYQETLKLLTYQMALAQPNATSPLLAGSQALASVPLSQRLSSLSLSAATTSEGQSVQQVARRWVRDSDELCVASIRRSTNINRINTYVATYKFNDPQWKPFLLPEVHILPLNEDATSASPSASIPPPPSATTSDAASASRPLFEVFVDYNKMNTLELVSRHANYALRHLVQKGHAMYFVNYAQHSLLEMRGLVESTHITCAYGIRGERLRTHMVHTGPLDVRDVIEVDPATRRVAFNLSKKGVRKGVVAVSQVEGYGTWFQRKPMLWQRTRRIGALQSQLGVFGYELCAPEEVGRVRDYEVSLLAPHTRQLGSSGAEAVGLIASSQVAQNDRLYMGEFEAPVLAALDAVQQLAHATARHHKLVQPPSAHDPSSVNAHALESTSADAPAGTAGLDVTELRDLRRRLSAERLLPVSWVTRTPPPYVPLEGDLPFKLQMSKPSVFATQETHKTGAIFPTGGTVGSPFVRGVPLSLYEYNVHQGVDHYVFDDAPSARPMKWWNQKSNIPYNGYLYCIRSGLLDYVVPAERLENPLAPPSAGRAGASHRRSTKATQRLKRLRKRRLREQVVPTSAPDAEAEEAQRAFAGVQLGAELWDPAAEGQEGDLVGHGADMRQEEADLAAPAEAQEARVQYRAPVHHIVPPSERAARRARRYGKYAESREAPEATTATGSAAPRSSTPQTAADHASAEARGRTRGVNQVLRKKLRRLHAAEAKKKAKKDETASAPQGDGVK